LDGRFDQRPYVYGWLKVAPKASECWKMAARAGAAIAAERDCGKSLVQRYSLSLGGRAAKPYRYMSGATEFNSDLFGAEHLMVEDEVPSTDIRTRRIFGARIKDFMANELQSCHAKQRQAQA
jgi:hypothetical protein